MRANAYIEQAIIETDISLMPYTETLKEQIIRIPEPFAPTPFLKTDVLPNIEIYFQKSPRTVTYIRSFNKYDDYFSYVGGLVGTIIGMIFIMGNYTEKTYEVSLAKKVLLNNDSEEIESNSFNMGYWFMMYVKRMLNFFKCDPDWPKVQMYLNSCEEVSMQIDITYMVRKLMFLDSIVAQLMEKHEIEALYLRVKPTLDKAKDQRRMHFAPELYTKQKKEEDNSERPFGDSIS